MPMYKHTSNIDDINWLASAKYTNFTEYADKTYKSGEVFKKDGKAVGLVFNDVTVAEGDPKQPVAVMVDGFVVEDRLPAKVEDADKAAMPGIKFR